MSRNNGGRPANFDPTSKLELFAGQGQQPPSQQPSQQPGQQSGSGGSGFGGKGAGGQQTTRNPFSGKGASGQQTARNPFGGRGQLPAGPRGQLPAGPGTSNFEGNLPGPVSGVKKQFRQSQGQAQQPQQPQPPQQPQQPQGGGIGQLGRNRLENLVRQGDRNPQQEGVQFKSPVQQGQSGVNNVSGLNNAPREVLEGIAQDQAATGGLPGLGANAPQQQPQTQTPPFAPGQGQGQGQGAGPSGQVFGAGAGGPGQVDVQGTLGQLDQVGRFIGQALGLNPDALASQGFQAQSPQPSPTFGNDPFGGQQTGALPGGGFGQVQPQFQQPQFQPQADASDITRLSSGLQNLSGPFQNIGRPTSDIPINQLDPTSDDRPLQQDLFPFGSGDRSGGLQSAIDEAINQALGNRFDRRRIAPGGGPGGGPGGAGGGPGGGTGGGAGPGGPGGGPNCFRGDMRVLMADGSRVPIKEVEIGDKTSGGVVTAKQAVAGSGKFYQIYGPGGDKGPVVDAEQIVQDPEDRDWKFASQCSGAVEAETPDVSYDLIVSSHQMDVEGVECRDALGIEASHPIEVEKKLRLIHSLNLDAEKNKVAS